MEGYKTLVNPKEGIGCYLKNGDAHQDEQKV